MKSTLTFFLALFVSLSFAKNKPYKAIDKNGKVLFTIEAESVSEFSGGLARIKQLNLINNEWVRGYGYVNKTGKVVIPCIYEKARDFFDGITWVKKANEEHWVLINTNGEELTSKKYEKVGYVMKGYSDRIAVYEEGALGWINQKGIEVIPCKYVGSPTFDPQFGLACVTPIDSKEEIYGFIDKNGKVVIPYQYKQAGHSSFHNGYCRVSVNGRTVLINEKGDVVFTPKFGSLQNISKGLMAVATKLNREGWGYINLKNELIIPAIYDSADPFNELGFATVQKVANYGIIDTLGNEILPIKYETVYNDPIRDGFICGVYPTTEPTSLFNTQKDYFMSNLQPLNLGDFTLMSAKGSDRIPFVNKEKKRGYLDRNFNVVIEAKYSRATAFSEGIALVLE